MPQAKRLAGGEEQLSLLGLDPSAERCRLARMALEWHQQYDPRLNRGLDERQRELALQDIAYGIECLSTAVRFQSGPLFADHARWMHDVLINRLPQHTPEWIKQILLTHYQALREVFVPTLSADQATLAEQYLQRAAQVTADAPNSLVASEQPDVGPHAALRQEYLATLLADDRIGAIRVIMEAHRAGIPVPELYVRVLQPTMYQIGQLWQQGALTISQEHRSGLITQAVMARLSAERLGVSRHGRSIVACSVGNELHEIGVRMICDIFELEGWDSYCPGAAVPLDRVLWAVGVQEAGLLALSVTMSIHLEDCYQVIMAARERFDNLRIAVGGRPFLVDPELWRRWPVDICVSDVVQFAAWANGAFGLR